jgi:hypothetical protein
MNMISSKRFDIVEREKQPVAALSQEPTDQFTADGRF